jgi:dGTPase
MDFADDVAYSVHDFEDAVVSGFINLEQVADRGIRAGLIDKISLWNGGILDRSQLEEAFANLESNEFWLRRFSGEQKELATLKNLSSALIGNFVLASTNRTLESAHATEVTRYQSQLLVPIEIRAQISVLKGLVSAFLMSIDSRKGFYEYQRAILTELADALLAANGKYLDTYATWAWGMANNEIDQRRVIIDQVACLTDQSAINLHYQLVGSKATGQ